MTTKRQPPWNEAENAALVALYFSMLDKAVKGNAYNKAAMVRYQQIGANGVAGPLFSRSKGSIEAKLMNASAAHRDLGGAVTMDGYGYRCLSNYQASLKDAVFHELRARDNRFVAEQLGESA